MTMSLSSFEEPSILTIYRNILQAITKHGEIDKQWNFVPMGGGIP